MAAQVPGIFPESIQNAIKSSKVLVVGAGGIGCELLKNLVLSGFHDIEVIDLDTIDVSNLNRQFLFHKQHVGRSKSQVARESALRFCPQANIVAHHDTIMSPDYGATFYQKFSLVMNALDNRAARNHVNRMCLAADVTLVESGSAGYLGQVTVIRKGSTECYECQPKAAAKTFPGCTIRNTPSEPIHCIVWAKHLFNQLFGEGDPDEDVSPDSADPELRSQTQEENNSSQNGATNQSTSDAAAGSSNGSLPAANAAGNVERTSTRTWAQSHNYDPQVWSVAFVCCGGLRYSGVECGFCVLWRVTMLRCGVWLLCVVEGYDAQKLFSKLFHDDIAYLLSMDKLWSKRRKPTPLSWDSVMAQHNEDSGGSAEGVIKDQVLWTLPQCLQVLSTATADLSKRFQALSSGDHLVWDKDDKNSMDFVTACANIRAHVFGIAQKTRFDVKSMAGNIIPAIATTNAIIAGLLVLEAIKVLDNRFEDCRTVYLNRLPNPRGRVLVPCRLEKPVPTCYVCSAKNEVSVQLNSATTTLAVLEEKILKGTFNMVAPDVEVADGKGTILISSEPGETTHNLPKTLKDFSVVDGTRLNCDDFLQNYTLALTVLHCDSLEDGAEFRVVADAEQLKKIQDSASASEEPAAPAAAADSKADDSDDDIQMVEAESPAAKKRKTSTQESEQPLKKPRLQRQEDDDIVLL
ncbi:Ubiquitin-activating enzyme catalytic cysteine domain [Trinorchestia longiramus]|nr:Ubiquitin-activating enzyme catalytic cysteine domain [Trinorchestia longiramus]